VKSPDPAVERLLRETLAAGSSPEQSDGCLDAETVAAWMDRTLGHGADRATCRSRAKSRGRRAFMALVSSVAMAGAGGGRGGGGGDLGGGARPPGSRTLHGDKSLLATRTFFRAGSDGNAAAIGGDDAPR
jgi:hypothetical protein